MVGGVVGSHCLLTQAFIPNVYNMPMRSASLQKCSRPTPINARNTPIESYEHTKTEWTMHEQRETEKKPTMTTVTKGLRRDVGLTLAKPLALA
jgi:hypothetical protein